MWPCLLVLLLVGADPGPLPTSAIPVRVGLLAYEGQQEVSHLGFLFSQLAADDPSPPPVRLAYGS